MSERPLADAPNTLSDAGTEAPPELPQGAAPSPAAPKPARSALFWALLALGVVGFGLVVILGLAALWYFGARG